MPDIIEEKPPQISGVVAEITFRNEENGFCVLELEWNGEPTTVVGVIPEVFPGEELTVTGRWTSHPTFGDQMQAESFERRIPSGASAVLRYLSSGVIKGVGPSLAARIVETFGEETLYVIETSPGRLAQIQGISKKKAAAIAEEYKNHHGLSDLIAFLGRYSATPTEAMAAWKRWGGASHDIIERNPYVLCTTDVGVSFERVDKVCAELERPADDRGRMCAGIIHILIHNLDNGHTCIPRRKLIPAACGLLGQDAESVEESVNFLIEENELSADTLGDEEFVFLTELYEAETFCAGRIRTMVAHPPPPVTGFWRQVELNEQITGISYAEAQREAIGKAMEHGMLVLTGGPGTGKTTTLNAIIDILETSGQRVSIAAPTGRAAKRISEITGREGKTIHRLLEAGRGPGDTSVFARDEQNPLTCDALVVDELSMTDATLFMHLLRALPIGSRLIMVGDSDQLPSVGAGNVLADLISSGRVPVVQLREIFRQAQKSAIVTNAHRIVSGEMPDISRKDSDFFFMTKENAEEAAFTVEDLFFRRLPNAYGYNPLQDIQILCPGKKGTVGTRELNRRIQARVNPPNQARRELRAGSVVFREGDKVMQIKNNYDISWEKDGEISGQGVFNGDIGILEKIDKFSGAMTVRFDDRKASYDKSNAIELEHAYAITVHKSQGSEFDAVIMPMLPGPPQLCYRNLLYTAVTRAKSLLVMVGTGEQLAAMAAGTRKSGRYTGMGWMLRSEE